MHRFRPATLLLIGFCCTACLAEAVAQMPEALRACVSQKEDSQRLACYDREIARLDKQVEASAVPPAAAVAAAEKGFGLPREVPKEAVDRRKSEQVEGKIASIVSRPHGERVVTLDNGQIWAQKSPDLLIRLKEGDEVTIKRGAFGSYLLVASGRSTTVMRVQ